MADPLLFFSIDGMACAQHIDDRLPYLEKSGISPVLLTSVCGLAMRDDTRKGALGRTIRHPLRAQALAQAKHVVENHLPPSSTSSILPFYLIEKLIVDLDSQWSWFPWLLSGGYRSAIATG